MKKQQTEVTIKSQEAALLTQEQQILLGKNQMRMGAVLIATALKTIRDERLYAVRGCDSMTDYCNKYLDFSQRSIERYLKLADSFAPQILQKLQELGITKILDLAKDAQLKRAIESGEIEIEGGKFVYKDGTTEEIQSVVARIRDELRAEMSQETLKLRAHITQLKNRISAHAEVCQNYEEQLAEQREYIAKLEQSVRTLAERKDADPRALVLITQKKEAIELITSHTEKIRAMLGEISNLPKEIVDAEVAGTIAFCVSSTEAALQFCRDEWQAYFFIPGKHERPIDVVPE
jgi:chromosome segregation ATPase